MSEQVTYKMIHVGINQNSSKEAHQLAGILSDLFHLEIIENPNSIFLDQQFEIMKTAYLGKHGHIAIATNDIEAAMEELTSKGILFNEDSIVYDDQHAIKAIYFMFDIADFAFHLVKLT